jgi:hypothetical protein
MNHPQYEALSALGAIARVYNPSLPWRDLIPPAEVLRADKVIFVIAVDLLFLFGLFSSC